MSTKERTVRSLLILLIFALLIFLTVVGARRLQEHFQHQSQHQVTHSLRQACERYQEAC